MIIRLCDLISELREALPDPADAAVAEREATREAVSDGVLSAAEAAEMVPEWFGLDVLADGL